jgi:hypothetical protein
MFSEAQNMQVDMRCRVTFRCLLLVLYGFTYVRPAAADTVSYNFSGTFPVTTSVQPSASSIAPDFSLPQFDPGLGSLESVSIDVSASFSGLISLQNEITTIAPECISEPDLSGCTRVISGTLFLYLGGSDSAGDSAGFFGPPGVASTSVASPTPLSPFQSATVPLSLSGTSQFSINSVLPYIGMGRVTFSDVNALVAPVSIFPFGHGAEATLTVDQFPITIDLTYTFTPPAVPEPRLAGVVGGILGLLIMACAARRRHNTAA